MSLEARRQMLPADEHPVMPGMIVQSKAGHDRFRLFLVMRVDGDRVWLADGHYRPLDRQKKKNIQHVRIIEREARADLLGQLQALGETGRQNAFLKKALTSYTTHHACRRRQERKNSSEQHSTDHSTKKEEG